METFVKMLLAGSIVQMQLRFFRAKHMTSDMETMIDLGDQVLTSLDYEPGDWGEFTVVNGQVRIPLFW